MTLRYSEIYQMKGEQYILRQRGLIQPRKNKHKTKKDLREVKKHWKLFGQLSTDTKYLRDIPNY